MTDHTDLIETVARAICAEDARINGRKPCGSSRRHACRVCALLATAAVTATDEYRAALLREAVEALDVAEEALFDLGACEDPKCQEPCCAGALPRVRTTLAKIKEAKNG